MYKMNLVESKCSSRSSGKFVLVFCNMATLVSFSTQGLTLLSGIFLVEGIIQAVIRLNGPS